MEKSLSKPLNMSLVETHNALAPSEIQSFLPPLPSSVRLYTPTTIPGRTFERVFGLVRDNMAAMYRRSSMGWSAARKREEMRHPAMRFLVLSSHQATVPGDAKGDVGGVSRAGGVAAEKGEEAGEGEKEAPEGEKEAKEGEEEAPEGEEEAEEGEEEAREGEGEVGVEGFASFMVTEEGGEEVIYWWVRLFGVLFFFSYSLYTCCLYGPCS